MEAGGAAAPGGVQEARARGPAARRRRRAEARTQRVRRRGSWGACREREFRREKRFAEEEGEGPATVGGA